MSKWFLIVLAVFILCFFIIIAFIVPHQFRKKTVIVSAVICILICGTFCAYALNTTFRHLIDINISKTTQHIYILDNEEYSIPLPDNTAFNYRTSDTQAIYITTSSIDEISDFYLDLAENQNFSNSDKNVYIELLFMYQNDNFILKIEDKNNKRYINIDVIV